ncbi:MAG: tetratricopeptide repeat protein [Bacteroidetes bacterium]|nr:tetratricopeptide repeat protein [Bacteroidota bacterium]
MNILYQLSEESNDDRDVLNYASQSMQLAEKLNYKKGIADASNNVGYAYMNLGDIPKALEYYHRSLKIQEELSVQETDSTAVRESKIGIANSLNNIAYVYDNQGDITMALEYFHKSLTIREEIKDKAGTAQSLNNIGVVYNKKGDVPNSLECFQKSLSLHEELKDKNGIGGALSNIGTIYHKAGDISKALEYYQKSLAIRETINDKAGIANTLINIGGIFFIQKNYSKAEKYFIRSLQLAKEIGFPASIRNASNQLSNIYSVQSKFKQAFEMQVLFKKMADSISNEETRKSSVKKQMQYDFEKKEQSIKSVQDKKDAVANAESRKQKLITGFTVFGLLFTAVFAFFIFRERKKSEKLLLNILPIETARELKTSGKAKAKHYEQVTVMFTDFKGFTNIAEKLSAEELVSELDFLFKKFDEIISNYQIEKIKTIGDAYMCASGLPTPNNNHAENIVNASLEMQNWMTSQNGKWQLRIGIHTGPVTAGVVGNKKFAYDIWGDTVNIAARMEQSGESGKINISGNTYQFISPVLVEKGWEVKHRGKIPAKNIGEVDMYFIEMKSAANT